MNRMKRVQYIVQGQVQGVGFRPFVYRIALDNNVSGFVGNTPLGVCIEIQGNSTNLDAFDNDFQKKLPPLARISSQTKKEISPLPLEMDFRIHISEQGTHSGHNVLVSPDVATCSACRKDILDTQNRRYAYAFTNCTDCGPRYTIIKSIPYDRQSTSMACFPLCAKCEAEYTNPLDRRFHAQPNACEECGPLLWLVDTAGNKIAEHHDAVSKCLELLKAGKIVAIKSLGGFQLACDAQNIGAINAIRSRKNRPHKSLAVMVPDMDTAHKIAHISPNAQKLLESSAAPIVLCPKKNILPESIAPDTKRIGIMLAYTPLHMLLFHREISEQMSSPVELEPLQASLKQEPLVPLVPLVPLALVMTSANASGEPICIGNREAFTKLAYIADAYLFHNRDILVRVDDSVALPWDMTSRVTVTTGAKLKKGDKKNSAKFKKEGIPSIKSMPKMEIENNSEGIIYFRRARGYVPTPIELPQIPEKKSPVQSRIIGFGAHLKATFCITRGKEAFVSQHIGDMENLACMEFYEESLAHMLKLLEIKPQLAVCDLHPDFLSTRMAQDFSTKHGIELVQLQHHFAHVYAVLAEHSKDINPFAPVLALSLDGTGYGTDGSIWGGELLLVEGQKMQRLGRLRPFSLPGGEMAIQEPWRIAHALYREVAQMPAQIQQTEQTPTHKWQAPWYEEYEPIIPFLNDIIRAQIQCPKTSSCGRLFDAVSALCGLCSSITYEGQAAIRLEEAQGLTTILNTLNTLNMPDTPNTMGMLDVEIYDILIHNVTLNTPSILDNPNASTHNHTQTWAQARAWDSPEWELDTQAFFKKLVEMCENTIPVSIIARFFHINLARSFASLAKLAADKYATRHVVLCGGVMNNETMLIELCKALTEKGLIPVLPQSIPSGDAAISLGQAWYGTLYKNT